MFLQVLQYWALSRVCVPNSVFEHWNVMFETNMVYLLVRRENSG